MGDMTVDELKDKNLWFLWSAKPGKNGKVTKVPFAANGGATGTDDAHKGTWVSFDDAESARNQFQASGLGLKITKGFFLLDIDHKDISDPFAQLMLQRLLAKETFVKKTIRSVKTSDAKLFLIKLQQEDGKSYSSIHTIRGVLRPAFQMAVDDDILVKNPFGFQLAGVLVNDAVTREAITKDQMRKFLKFVHDDVVYCKYYEVVYILFHTGMRISEFCGLTLKDIDLENRTINIDHQLQRTSDMRYIIETTKTDAGTRVLPITEDVAQMFQAIIEDRNAPKVEKSIDGYSGFLFYDDNGMPLVAMHWQHRFNHMVGRYNDIYRVQMPNITPHVCRHTYCSNMAKSGMNPKTLQYLMGHSDISVTMNVYTHIGFDDAEEELKRMEEFRKAQAEVEQKKEKPMSQKMFKVV